MGDFFLQYDPLRFKLADAIFVGRDNRGKLSVCDAIKELIDAALGFFQFGAERLCLLGGAFQAVIPQVLEHRAGQTK